MAGEEQFLSVYDRSHKKKLQTTTTTIEVQLIPMDNTKKAVNKEY
tara:strand:- start:707 stop:841 length:135 start_codon:yes stop_codon:yes gene_type:complete